MKGAHSKGGRSVPWRDGGAVNKKDPEWLKKTKHCLGTLPSNEYQQKIVFKGQWEKSDSENIYLLDQACSKHGISFYAEYQLTIRVFSHQVSRFSAKPS